MKRINLTMLTDFYQLTMANGYFEHGIADKIAYYDMFFRRIPDNGGFAIMAGLEQVIDYLKDLKFTEEDIAFLRSSIVSVKVFWIIWPISDLPVMFGPFRKGRLSFMANR